MREAQINRKTNEVEIKGNFVIDGEGKAKLNTGFEPLNHLLTLFAFHGLFDLDLEAKGDLQHHIIEDIGITLGQSLKQALSNKKGINRAGYFVYPMDEALSIVALDISGRPNLKFEADFILFL